MIRTADGAVMGIPIFDTINCVVRSGELKWIHQQHRISFARSTSAHADIPRAPGVGGTPMSPQTALTSHPPSSLMRKPPTAPALSINTQAPDTERPRSRESAMGEGDGNGAPEICLSPSWSDFGGSKKRKEKKRLGREKKEHDKKQKSESDELRAGESGAGKRLSKKPPAAMDTQKMPSALRRNSGVSFLSYSSSQEDSRQSHEEGRLSRSSIGSRGKRRSRSTPGISAAGPSDSRRTDSSVVSAAPPQLPKLRGFGWHSRQSSSNENGKSAGSGGAYDKDLVQFAYSLEASTNANHPGNFTVNCSENHTGASQRTRPLQLGPPPISRSRTAPDTIGAEEGRTVGTDLPRPPLTPGDSQDGNVFDRPSSGRGRHPRPATAGKENDDETRMQPTGKFMSDEFLQISRLHASSSGQGLQPSQVKSLKDGSSYVHKQRMHQQQLSIAGYQDELAVRDANERMAGNDVPAAEGPSVASTRSASSESSKQRTPQTSIDSEGRAEDEILPQEQPAQPAQPAVLKDPQNSVATSPVQASPVQASPGSRAEKILSFRPFQKKGKPSKAPAVTRPILPIATPSSKSPSTLQSSLTPRAVPSPQKSAKAERPLGESTPQVNKSLPNSPKGRGKDAAKENIPETATPKTPVQTRPSSSPVSNEDGLIPRAVRSSTAPMLPFIAAQTSTSPDPVDATVVDESDRQPDVGSPKRSTPRGPRSPPADIKTLPKLPPEIIVEGVNGEGLVHKTSIKRPRSNPNLLTAAPGMPSLDFLPQLKHQPLTKPKRTSPIRPSFTSTPDRVSFPASSQFPVPASPTLKFTSDSNLPTSTSAPDLKLMPRSPLRPTPDTAATADNALLRPGANVRRRTMGPLTFGNGGVAQGLDAKPVAKLFVICCKCKFWHDLPSHLYELMAVPRKLSRRDSDEAETGSSGAGAEGRLDTMVQCPWCQHPMTTWCCAGWTTVVYLHERHH